MYLSNSVMLTCLIPLPLFFILFKLRKLLTEFSDLSDDDDEDNESNESQDHPEASEPVPKEDSPSEPVNYQQQHETNRIVDHSQDQR